jgi:large subunit ribosomal protein L32e
MADIKRLLEVRKRIKNRKPTFLKQDAHKKARLAKKWKRPRGIHSKMRENRKGHPKSARTGYGSPNEVKGLHKSGLMFTIINSPPELAKLDAKKQGIVIGSQVGVRKKVEIVRKALEIKASILNMKEPEKFLKETEELFKKKLEEKKMKEAEKEKKAKEKEKAAAEKKEEKKESVETIVSDEEKKEQEKKEFDKLLTQKE